MGHQIIKQPNGKYAIWSDVVDHFILVHCDEQDIVDYYVEKQTKSLKENVAEEIAALERGEKPHAQFTKTFEEALDWIREVHGTEKYEAFLQKWFIKQERKAYVPVKF